ncbi:MAG: hypothetical protein PHS49_03265 [Candidatus Gracilibacteria bacterium]|nr:hypothetical protein [Candidatus Gracilibacteria bacterium]
MTKTIIFIVIIIIIGVFIYMMYFTNNSPSIMGNNYDTEMSNKNNNTKESEIQTRINSLVFSESTFKITNCNELIIQQYNKANDKKTNKEFIVKDINTINEITNTLNELPEDGEEFRSFIPTIPYTLLTFVCNDNKNYKVEIYSDKIKTPGTTFYSSNTQTGEKTVIDIVNKLISSN